MWLSVLCSSILLFFRLKMIETKAQWKKGVDNSVMNGFEVFFFIFQTIYTFFRTLVFTPLSVTLVLSLSPSLFLSLQFLFVEGEKYSKKFNSLLSCYIMLNIEKCIGFFLSNCYQTLLRGNFDGIFIFAIL